jgi:hypothetical protein
MVRLIPTVDEVRNCGSAKMGLLVSEDCKTVGLPADKVKEKLFMAGVIASFAPANKYSIL